MTFVKDGSQYQYPCRVPKSIAKQMITASVQRRTYEYDYIERSSDHAKLDAAGCDVSQPSQSPS